MSGIQSKLLKTNVDKTRENVEDAIRYGQINLGLFGTN